jgi:hypothetical protein
MAELLKKTGEKLKKAGHTVEEKAEEAGHKVADASKSAGHKVVDVSKDVGHKTAEGAKSAGQKTAKGAEHAVGRIDITCDNCGKLMKPGGEYTRVVMGKEYQFCSVQCSIHFHPPMK